MIRTYFRAAGAFAAAASLSLFAQQQVPTPESVFGYKPGADFKLTTYEENIAYFQKLDAASDYLKLVNVGKTSQGRDWFVAVISTPQNLAQLDKYKDIARRLAQVKGLNDDQARQLAREGKVIVHIDGGLHATEVAGQEHTPQLAYNLISKASEPEYARILNEAILVLWPSINPDGQTMVANWYRHNLGTTYEVAPLPWLYQEYIGHDNNRDGYMNNMVESRVVNKNMFEFWPQVMYNHHQTAPFPSRIWIPPFAEPVSAQVHPLMWRWVNVFGTSMATYLDQHNMPGAMHRGRFDDWYPGFIDHVNSFRNTVSFLTETALYRYATPRYYTIDEFPKEKQDLRSEVFYSSPWKGGWWRLKDAVDYMTAASMSVLTTAAKNREELLFNRYQAGRDTIARYTKEPPYAYVIPADQRDLPTAAILVEKLMLSGLEVMEATDPVQFNGMTYKTGSWVISMDQPFARLAHELFEVQKYPELPDAPYDVTGWTLPMQMGVETAAVTVPLEAQVKSKLKKLTAPPAVPSVPVTRQQNISFKVINESLASGAKPDAKLSPPAKAPRIGLYRPWTASIDEGWTRWVFEQFKFPYTSLYNADVQAGHLKDRFDVIVIADMSSRSIMEGHQPGTIEGRYAGGIGDQGAAALREFVTTGGTLVTMNASSQFAIDKFNLPVTNVLQGVRQSDFNCPGALLRVELTDTSHPLVAGLPKEVNVMFERGPAFETKSGFKGKILASYPRETNPLMSGYILKPEKIQGKAALVDVQLGGGHVVMIGFRSQWRGQPHGTFKFLFNSLYYFGATSAGTSTPVTTTPTTSTSSASAEAGEWRRLAASVKTDVEKLASANKSFFGAKGAKALDESKKLDAAVTAFLRDRVSAIEAFRDQIDDRSVARKVSEYGQAARKLANDASVKDWSESKDVAGTYKLDALDQEVAALLAGNKKP
jgi:hypothetical protein